MKKLIIIISFLSLSAFGQNLKKHKWKKRILIINVEDKNSKELKKQIKILSPNKKEIKERKLIIYKISKKNYSINFENEWYQKNRTFNKTKSFEIKLIGLDGSLKYKQDSIISTKKLFSIIDGMPMRKSELINKNK